MNNSSDPSVQMAVDAALALHQSGQRAEAERQYRQILATMPRHAIAWHLLGAVLHEQGRSAEAAECIERAITLENRDHLFFANLGEVYRVLRRWDDALAMLQRARQMTPGYAETYYKLGLVHSDLRRHDEAIACFQQTLALNPSHADALNNWGCELTKLDRPGEAIPLFARALAINPRLSLAHNNLGAALSVLERAGEALEHYRRALELEPGFHEAYSNLLFASNYETSIDRDELYSLHVEFGRRYASQFPAPPPWPNDRSPERRLKIGYVSGDFRRHPVAYFVWPLLRAHDRRRFEILCYDNYPKPDDFSALLRSASDQWVSTVGWTDEQVVERIRADGVDIAVDLAGHTTRNRLMAFARRVAPVQVSYLGYVTTTGLPQMDYRITDAYCDPVAEPVRHTERLVRLPRLFCAYGSLPDAPPVAPPPCQTRGYVTFGSLHNLSKLGPTTIELWSKVLQAVPSARLRIVRATLTSELQGRLLAAFARHGIAAERLDLVNHWPPGTSHLSCYDAIDVTLDVVPWSGHTTVCESMWMGVPVVTLHGDRHAGRMVSSILNSIGAKDWIAQSTEEFVAIAAAWGANVDQLAGTRQTLRPRLAESALCDGAALTRELEDAYRSMWRQWCKASE